jgi:hypothetical protein
MSEENEDGWSTINTSPDNKKEAPPVIEFEDSEGDTVAAPESQVDLEIVQEEQSTDEKKSQEPEELQGINTKGAEKRIRKLVAQRKERDEQITLALDKIRYLENALSDKDKNITDYQRQSVDSKKEEIQRRVETAKASFSRAFDDGDKDTLVKSQSDLSEAQAELKMLEYAVLMNQSRGTQELPTVSQSQATPQRAQPQKFDENAVEWAEKNEWFGKDKIGTTIALAMDQSLKEEGFDPRDDDFYEELDKRLSTELPARLRPGGGDVKTNTQVVAGQSRRQATSNKVRLTQADVSLAKKWGLTLERYAAEKKKAERSAGDYTLING